MIIIALALQMAAYQHSATSAVDAPRIDVSTSTETLTELPSRPHHMHHIDATALAGPTIAYCDRTGQTRCENWVSSISGGTKIVVCKVKDKWVVDRCPAPKKK